MLTLRKHFERLLILHYFYLILHFSSDVFKMLWCHLSVFLSCRFSNQLRRKSPMAAVLWLLPATWSPSKPRNEGRGWGQMTRVSLVRCAFVFCVWRIGYPSCCQYWKDIHSYLMKAKYFVVLSTGVNWYFTMKTSGVLHSILQLVFATYDCSIRKM